MNGQSNGPLVTTKSLQISHVCCCLAEKGSK